MPISFHCETCRRSILVPDGSEGKKTRCPGCSSIVQIPFDHTGTSYAPEPLVPTEPADPLGIEGKYESRWNSDDNDPVAPANPFREVPAAPATPSPSGEPRPLTHDQLTQLHKSRDWLTAIAAILLTGCLLAIVVGMIGLIFGSSAYLNATKKNSLPTVPLIVALVLFVLHMVTIFLLNEVRMLRNYKVAKAAMILAMIPLSNLSACLIAPVFLASWGFKLLGMPAMRYQFRSEAESTPE